MKNTLFTLGCLTAVFLVIFAPARLSAADTSWEGTASMSRFGEFPVTGFYGASNSFPRNTIVRVTNVKNGKETTVIVSDRLTNSSLFILLSREAAMALDIPQDEVARVTVSVAEAAVSAGAVRTSPLESAYSPDPDRNPAAGTVIPESAPVITTAVPETAEPAAAAPVEETNPLPETPFANYIASGPASGNGPILIPMLLPVIPEEPKPVTDVPKPVPEPAVPDETVTASSLSGSPEESQAVGIVPDLPEVAAEPAAAGEIPLAVEIGGSPAPETFALETVVMPEQPGEEPAEGAIAQEAPSVSEVAASPASGGMIAAVPLSEPEEPAETDAAAGGPEIPAVADIASINPAAAAVPLPLLMEPGVPEPAVLASGGAESVPAETLPPETGPTAAELAAVIPPETGEVSVAALLPDVSAESPGAAETPAAAVIEEGNPMAAETPDLAMADVPPETAPLAMELSEGSPQGPAPEVTAADMAALNLPEMTEETASVATAPETVTETGPVITEDTVPALTVPETAGTALVLEPAEPRPPEDVTPLAAVEVAGGKTGETSLVLTPAEMRPPEPIVKAPAAAEKPAVEKPAAVVTAGAKTADTRIALADTLQKGSFYVQLGVYSEAESAKRLADAYSTSFPMSIYKTKEDKYYKVLLGPVNEDETGSLLFNFKKKGFKDAFIRQEK